MVGARIKTGLVVGVLGLGVTLLGSSVASATSTSTVLSDKVVFSGNVASPSPGNFTFSSTKCKVTSDTETTVICQLTSSFTLSSTGAGSGNATLTSSDGTTTWSYTLTPTSSTTWKMKGKGMEADTAENGTPPPPPYPATVRGNLKATSATTASGNFAVYEASTQP